MNLLTKAGIGCGTLLLLAIAAFYLSRVSEVRSELKAVPAPEREQIRKFLKEPIKVSEEWTQPKQYSRMTRHLHALVVAAWANNERELVNSPYTSRNSNFARQRDLEGDAETTATNILSGAGGMVINLVRLTMQPDYDLEIFSSYSLPGAVDPMREVPEAGAKLLALQAAVLAKAERYGDAVSALMAGLRLARRSPASRAETHLRAMRVVRGTSAATADFVQSCRNPVAITSASIAMKQLEPALFPQVLPDLQKLHMLSTLRMARGEGYPVEVQTTETGAMLINDYASFITRYPQWQLDRIGKSDPMRDAWQKLADETSEHAAFRTRGVTAWMYRVWLGDGVHEVAYARLRENPEPVALEVNLAKAAYDLTRLVLAQQRFLLEQRTAVEKPEQVIPAYVEPLTDPYSGKPYKWSQRAQRFYSIGPDGKDNELRVLIRAEADATGSGDLIVP